METRSLIQGSQEWHAARVGRVTASRVSDVIAKTKSGAAASRSNYLAELVCERLSEVATEGYTNAAMQHGTATEPEARAAYAFATDTDVQEVGFIPHPTIDMAGASPDGMSGADGLLEIKCPSSKTHIETLLGGSVDRKYIVQMQWQMACTGRKWCDFVSYDNRLPASMSLFIKRVERDDVQIAELEKEVRMFLKEVAETVAELQSKYELKDAA